MDALVNERAQQLRRRQTIIHKDPNTIRVPMNTIRQTTNNDLDHNKPQTVPIEAPTAIDGLTLDDGSDNIRRYVRKNGYWPTTKNRVFHNGM
jgi:hypothetical protein